MRGFLFLTASWICLLTLSCKEEANPSPTENIITEEDQLLIDELDQQLLPLEASPLELRDEDLSFLDAWADVKLIGLGEATHGGREFFQYKHRLFQYFVENFGHSIFGFEADFAESIYINNHLLNGLGDISEIMIARMHFWTWQTEEVRDLLLWMRAYNVQHADNPLQYFGFDCQFMTYQGPLLRSYLLSRDSDFAAEVAEVINPIVSANENEYAGIDDEQFLNWQEELNQLLIGFDERKEEFVASSDPQRFAIHRHLIRNLQQTLDVNYYQSIGDNSLNYRDAYMAENAIWISENIADNGKVSLWGHNAHMAKDPGYGIGGSMGNQLRRQVRDDYQVMGFGFSKGEFTAVTLVNGNYTNLATQRITVEPLKPSFNFLFHHASVADFYINPKELQQNEPWKSYLISPRRFLSIGSIYNNQAGTYYRSVDLDFAYDGIIYLRETMASVLL